MPTDPTGKPDLVLDRVAVRGSRFRHYAMLDGMLTLCGRIPDHKDLRFLPTPACHRCDIEASMLPAGDR